MREQISLTTTQKQLWIDIQKHPNTKIYNSLYVYRLNGFFDTDVVTKSWAEIVENFHNLRTVFFEEDGEVYQNIFEFDQDFNQKNFVELTNLNTYDDIESTIKDYVEFYKEYNWDLSALPLHKLHCVSLSDKCHLLFFACHHLLIDHTTYRNIIQSFFHIYEEITLDNTIDFKCNHLPIKQYYNYEKEYLLKHRQSASSFWEKYLQEFNPKLNLPKKSNIDSSHAGKRIYCTLQPNQASELKKLAIKNRTTVFNVLATVYFILLFRYTNQLDITVGYPNNDRLPGFGVQPGFFINNLPLRISMAETDVFTDVLKKVNKAVGIAPIFKRYPHSEILTALRKSQQGHIDRLFSTVFSCANFGNYTFSLKDLEVSNVLFDINETHEEMIFLYDDQADNCILSIEYNIEVYDELFINHFLKTFTVVLSSVLENTSQLITSVSLGETNISHKFLEKKAQEISDSYRYSHKRIHDIFSMNAQQYSEKIAIINLGSELTFSELESKSNQFAYFVLDKSQDSTICLLCGRSTALIIAILGVLKAGKCFSIFDPHLSAEIITDRMNYLESSTLVTLSNYQLELPENSLNLIITDNLSSCIEPYPSSLPINSKTAKFAYVSFSSGTTGDQKAISITHENFISSIQARIKFYSSHQTSCDRHLLLMSTGFEISLSVIFWPLFNGNALVLYPEKDLNVSYVIEHLNKHKITHFVAVPSVYNMLLEDSSFASCTNLVNIICGGESLTNNTLERHQSISSSLNLFNEYGPTECTGWISAKLIYDAEKKIAFPISLGAVIGNNYLFAKNASNLSLSSWEIGELCVLGTQVSPGYLKNSGLTKNRFIPIASTEYCKNYYCTGDFVRVLPNGEFNYIARIDSQMKINGKLIDIEGLELLLSQAPMVIQACICGSSENNNVTTLTAYLVIDQNKLIENEVIKKIKFFVKQNVSYYLQPSKYYILDKFPTTIHGKIDKTKLREFKNDSLKIQPDTDSLHKTSLQKILSDLWIKYLKIDAIKLQDDYFDLGGDSIISIQIVSEAKKNNIKIEVSDIFDYPNILELSQHVSVEDNNIDNQPVVEPRETAHVPLTPIQIWFFSLNYKKYNQYNQYALLDVSIDVGIQSIKSIIRSIELKYDVFKYKFSDELGEWKVSLGDETSSNTALDVQSTDLQYCQHQHVEKAIQEKFNELNKQIDIKHGPTFIVNIINLPNSDTRLIMMIAHHLVIDTVSWHFMLNDMNEGYQNEQLRKPLKIKKILPSFSNWAKNLSSYAVSQTLTDETSYWSTLLHEMSSVEMFNKLKTETNYKTSSFSEKFDQNKTEKLFFFAREKNIKFNELLYVILSLAIGSVTKNNSISFDVEGHGREKIFKKSDDTQALGWYTTFYPFHIKLDNFQDINGAINKVIEALSVLPNKGIGYSVLKYLSPRDKFNTIIKDAPLSAIILNYLGKVNQVPDNANTVFTPSKRTINSQETVSQDNYQPHAIEIGIAIDSGELNVVFKYYDHTNNNLFSDNLIKEFITIINNIINCQANDKKIYYADQFPFCQLNQSNIDQYFNSSTETIDAAYPLSPIQKGILYQAQVNSEKDIYHVQTLFEFSGSMNPKWFEQAWENLIKNHPVFRTYFIWEFLKEPIQVVLNQVPLLWTNIDWSDLSIENKINNKEELISEDRKHIFDLSKAPLSRFYFIKYDETQWFLLWTHHHAILDGWCLPIILKQVMFFYESLEQGRSASIAKSPSYKDYIYFLHSGHETKAFQYWQKNLANIDAPTFFPTRFRTNDANCSELSDIDDLVFSDNETRQLVQFAKDHSLTLNSLLQAAWAIQCHCYTQQDEVIYGATISGRPTELEDIDKTLGIFINTLPVIIDFSSLDNVAQVCKAIQKQLINLNMFSNISITEIQNKYEAVPNGALYNTIFVFENYPSDSNSRFQNSNITIKSTEAYEKTEFDITVVGILKDSLSISFRYNSEKVTAKSAQKIKEHFYNILFSVMKNYENSLADIDFLTLEEKDSLAHWNNTSKPLAESSLIDLIQTSCIKNTNSIAVIYENRTLQYKDLSVKSDQIAYSLLTKNIRKGDVVAVFLPRSLDLIPVYYAILKLGAVILPIDDSYPVEKIKYVLQDSLCKITVLDNNTELRFPKINSRDSINISKVTSPDKLMKPIPSIQLGQDDPVYIIYTSGSTGQPKGVINHQLGLLNRLQWMKDYINVTEKDNILQKTPIAFDVSMWEIFLGLICGAKTILAKPEGHKDPKYLYELINDKRITILHFVPSMLQFFLQENNCEIPTSLKTVIASGEALPLVTVELFNRVNKHHATLYNLYGPTEASIDVTAWQCNSTLNMVSIGKPIDNIEIFILDKYLRKVPIGIVGELCISGHGLAKGYLNKLDLTENQFVTNPYAHSIETKKLYRTGDFARHLSDGNIEYIGRVDQQIKLRGNRIEVHEIESTIASLSGVCWAAVLPVYRNNVVIMLNAYIQLDILSDNKLTASEINAYLHERLVSSMIPSNLYFIDKVPTTINGKLDKDYLLKIEDDNTNTIESNKLTNNLVTKNLILIYQKLFSVSEGELHANSHFFSLGGDSIKSIQFVSEARKHNLSIKVEDIYQYPKIGELANFLDSQCNTDYVEKEIKYEKPTVAPITPIQDWLLNQKLSDVNHYNQSVLIQFSKNIDLDYIKNKIHKIINLHDSLRSFFNSKNQMWEQVCSPRSKVNIGDYVTYKNFISVEDYNRSAIKSFTQLQKSFNVTKIPLIKFLMIKIPEEPISLFIVAHHLIIDAVSWKILLRYFDEEPGVSETDKMLQRLYSATPSYLDWAVKLERYYINKNVELKKHSSGKKIYFEELKHFTQNEKYEHHIEFNEQDTKLLLTQSHGCFDTNVNDLLIFTLISTIGDRVDNDIFNIDIAIETHGRFPTTEVDDAYLSKVIGWFTQIIPITFSHSKFAETSMLVKGVKELIQNEIAEFDPKKMVTDHAHQPQILFNYLGEFIACNSTSYQVDSVTNQGLEIAENNLSLFSLIINAQIIKSKLTLTWSSHCDANNTITKLAESYITYLKQVIDFLKKCKPTYPTSEDTNLTEKSDQATIDILLRKHPMLISIQGVSPMQKELYYIDQLKKTSDAYIIQNAYKINEKICPATLKSCCEYIFEKIKSLSSGFTKNDKTNDIYQFLSNKSISLNYIDWSQNSDENDLDTWLKSLLKEKPFILDQPPLIGLYLIKKSDHCHYFILYYHHILMDGWSNANLVSLIFSSYKHIMEGKSLADIAIPRTYDDYIELITQKCSSEIYSFWRTYLNSYIPMDIFKLKKEPNKKPYQQYEEFECQINQSLTSQLNSVARKLGVTLNVVILMAWSLLLYRYSKRTDICFGVTISGRAQDIDGISGMIGLFINTVPLRIKLDGDLSTMNLAKEIQAHLSQINQNGLLTGQDVRSLVKVKGNLPLFNSVIVFENYPYLDHDKLNIQRISGLSKGEIPLGLSIVPLDEILIKFDYDTTRFDRLGVRQIFDDLVEILQLIISDSRQGVAN